MVQTNTKEFLKRWAINFKLICGVKPRDGPTYLEFVRGPHKHKGMLDHDSRRRICVLSNDEYILVFYIWF